MLWDRFHFGDLCNIDFLGNKNILPHTVLNILYAQMFETELNEKELDDYDELYGLWSVVACVLAKKKSVAHL